MALAVDSDEAAMLDGVGAWIWEQLATGPDLVSLTTELGEVFEAPADRIDADVMALLADLEARGIVVRGPVQP